MTEKVTIDVGAIFNALTTPEERSAIDAINAKFEGMPVRLVAIAVADEEEEVAPKKTRRKTKGRRKAKAKRAGKKPGPKPGFKRAKRKGKKPGPKPGYKRKVKAEKAKTERVAKPVKAKVKRKYTRRTKAAVPAADADAGGGGAPVVAPRGRLPVDPPVVVKAPGES